MTSTRPVIDLDVLAAQARASGTPALLLRAVEPAEPGAVDCVVAWPAEPPLVADVVALFDSLGLRVARHSPAAGAAGVDRFRLLGWVGDVHDHGWFAQAFGAIHAGRAEPDGLNRLVVSERLGWRQVMVLRALGRYVRQAGPAISESAVERTLLRHGGYARTLVALFEARFDPSPGRTSPEAGLRQRLHEMLTAVTALEEDRVLAAMTEVVEGTVRTSYFQAAPDGSPRDRLTLKIEPRRLSFALPPVPLVETYVYSPAVEGLHLRMSRIARGGLRWSDRTDDFRAEVLGLVKAQAVKNSVIVPGGAKGAFVVRRSRAGLSPAEGREVVERCYADFVRGLLDVTDNLVTGRPVTPVAVRRHDDIDPYLVVAADKGTATFSDLANGVAAEYGYWLGDAFASGGSSGYDHKAMGITARGAWVSVEQHLDELGFDPDHDPLTVVGIGDMSGDVFGNGMLLSDRIRLVAAFDHRHIFVDPDPEPARSFAERARLFALPASDWTQYDASLISPGGGVFSRHGKQVPVSPQARSRLGIADEVTSLTPDQLVQCLLTAPVALLWNGGVGTYVKSAEESHAQVLDKANDAVRVDADRLRCLVVAEGGNLGLTQRARIDFALRGGRINTDFIDNSAGVNTSDHEVNLKILLDEEVRAGRLSRSRRDQQLAVMSAEVAQKVLADNRHQVLAISLAQAQGALILDRHARLLSYIEATAGLDRKLETMPEEEEIAGRRARGIGLTRPEIAVLLAWSKTTVRSLLLNSVLPEDPVLQDLVAGYFPEGVRTPRLIGRHPLAREISATVLANDLINQAGPGFLYRLQERTGAPLPVTAGAFAVARAVFGLQPVWRRLEDGGPGATTAARFHGLHAIGTLLERAATWLLQNRRRPVSLQAEIDRYAEPVRRLRDALPDVLTPAQHERVTGEAEDLVAGGLPADLARQVAELSPLADALNVVEAAAAGGLDALAMARIYFELDQHLELPWLRAQAADAPGDSHWALMAKAALCDELVRQQRRLATTAARGGGPPPEAVTRWLEAHDHELRRHRDLLTELRAAPVLDVAMLTVAVHQLRELTAF